jgi:hypothetical protein
MGLPRIGVDSLTWEPRRGAISPVIYSQPRRIAMTAHEFALVGAVTRQLRGGRDDVVNGILRPAG